MKNKRQGRRATRDRMMKYLYTMDMLNEFSRAGIERFIAGLEVFNEADYANRLIDYFLAERERIDAQIEAGAIDWSLNRMNKVDLAILRLSTTELMHLPDIPTEVIINEALELAKVYSSDEAQSFIHGVLGQVADAIGPR